jgi:imidazoleglycerol-phosphate dehydratase
METTDMARQAAIKRKTKETDIEITLTIEGNGESTVSSGNGFMNHMLTLFAKHGLFTLKCTCKGDTDVDFHHSAEDIGLCLGEAVSQALGDCKGITRFSTQYVPMDESLARVCMDISGRPNLTYSVKLIDRKINDFECDLVEDFFKAFSTTAKITVHVDLIRGRNSHHSIEAVFKAFGRALSEACSINPRASNKVPSSKGII